MYRNRNSFGEGLVHDTWRPRYDAHFLKKSCVELQFSSFGDHSKLHSGPSEKNVSPH
jgi:hypothetical protein